MSVTKIFTPIDEIVLEILHILHKVSKEISLAEFGIIPNIFLRSIYKHFSLGS